MATFRKRLGKWRVEVARGGRRESRTFDKKQDAEAWAARVEAEIIGVQSGVIPAHLTVFDLLDRYAKEVSPTKKGARWETVRIGLLKRDKIANTRLVLLDTPHLYDWQQRRLKAVSGESVRRERNLLSHAFNIAVTEWKWLKKNPFTGLRRPPGSKPRNRIATDDEIQTLLSAANDNLRRAIIVALETGMRASEIAASPKISGKVAILETSKTGDGRKIPLSDAAQKALVQGIYLTAGSISAEFAKLTKACEVKGLTFHDLRHHAISMLAKKLTPFELAKMVGHKDLKMTLNVYYADDPEAVARKLG